MTCVRFHAHNDGKFINQKGLSVHLKCVNPATDLAPASDYLQQLLQKLTTESMVKSVLKRTIDIYMLKLKNLKLKSFL